MPVYVPQIAANPTGAATQAAPAMAPAPGGLSSLAGSNYVAQTNGGPVAGTGLQGATSGWATVAPVSNVNPAQAQQAANVNGTGNVNSPTGQASLADKTTVDYTVTDPTKIQNAGLSGGVVQGYLNDLLSQDSAYMRNAQQQGLNLAAGRGLRNSSIAAGAAQASNIQNAQPILNQIMGLNNQREQQAFQAEQAGFDRGLTVARDNANMGNQVNLANAGAQNQMTISNNSLRSQTDLTNAQLNQQANLANQSNQQQTNLQNASLAQQAALANAQNQLQTNMQNAQNQQQTGLANASNQQQANLQNSQLQWQAEQSALNRTQGVNDRILGAELASSQAAQDYQFKNWLQDAGARQQDWLNSNQYSREFNSNVAALQMSTSADMFKQILSAAINNPQTFPPEVAAGMQNYFTGNWAAVLGKYFPNTVGGG